MRAGFRCVRLCGVLFVCSCGLWKPEELRLRDPEQNEHRKSIFLFTVTTIVFRGDTAVLFAPILLSMLVTRRVGLVDVVCTGLKASLLALALTVLVDSYFW